MNLQMSHLGRRASPPGLAIYRMEATNGQKHRRGTIVRDQSRRAGVGSIGLSRCSGGGGGYEVGCSERTPGEADYLAPRGLPAFCRVRRSISASRPLEEGVQFGGAVGTKVWRARC